MRPPGLLVCAAIVLACGVAVGDEIVLKNGRSMRGTIVSETDTEVVIELGGTRIPIPRKQIEKIVRSEAPPRKADRASKAEKTLLLFAFKGTNARMVYNAAQDLGRELGLRVKVIGLSPAPKTDHERILGLQAIKRVAAKFGIPTDRSHDELVDLCKAAYRRRGETQNVAAVERLRDSQLHARVLVEQVHEQLAKQLATPGVVGVVGVTSRDMYASGTHFLFGLAHAIHRVGVVATDRFGSTTNREFRGRLLKQLLSTTGYVLGLKRCTDTSCVRLFPKSVEELDTKPERLCKTCRKAVEAALED